MIYCSKAVAWLSLASHTIHFATYTWEPAPMPRGPFSVCVSVSWKPQVEALSLPARFDSEERLRTDLVRRVIPTASMVVTGAGSDQWQEEMRAAVAVYLLPLPLRWPRVQLAEPGRLTDERHPAASGCLSADACPPLQTARRAIWARTQGPVVIVRDAI
jgi:hypothetical protein